MSDRKKKKKIYAITAAACNTRSLPCRNTKNLVSSQCRAMFHVFHCQAHNCAELSFAMAFSGGFKGRTLCLLYLSVPVSATWLQRLQEKVFLVEILHQQVNNCSRARELKHFPSNPLPESTHEHRHQVQRMGISILGEEHFPFCNLSVGGQKKKIFAL